LKFLQEYRGTVSWVENVIKFDPLVVAKNAGSTVKDEPQKDKTFSPIEPTRTHRAGGSLNEGFTAGNGVENVPFPSSLQGFRVEGLAGQGGYGVVFKAFDLTLSRLVAVKRLRPDCKDCQESRERFYREGLLQARCRLPDGVVQIHQGGSDDYGPYLVMEWIDGVSLANYLRHGRDRSWTELVDLCCKVADIMQQVHDLGIVHRDLSPGNILVGANGLPKVTDFGLAKLAGAGVDQLPLTERGGGLGTPGFAAPEQNRCAASVTAAADTYSLAAVLHYSLTGEAPAPVGSDAGINTAKLVLYEVPQHVQNVLQRALTNNPAERFEHIAGFATALRQAAAGVRSEPPRQRWWLPRIVAFIAVTLVAAGMYFVDRQSAPNTERTPAVDSVIPASDLVTVLPGTFVMGQDGANAYSPKHSVEISRTLQVSRFEITQEQWFRVMGTRPWLAAGGRDDSRLPATGVTWRDAMEFCERLTQLEKSDRQYRLPTEAEWEYFSRGGSSSAWSCPEDQLAQHAWCAGSVGSADAPGPRPVGTRQPNPLGLHDVHGNVFEWCLDWFDPDYYLRSPAADPSGPLEPPAPADTETLAERVCRGGSWARNDVTCSSGFRFSASDEDSRSSLEFGFRVVAEDRGAPQAR
jgi:serine/threonine protein kinase